MNRDTPPSATQRQQSPAVAKRIAKRRAAVEACLASKVTVTHNRFTPKRRTLTTRKETRHPFDSPAKIARKINLDSKGISASKTTVRRDLLVSGRKAGGQEGPAANG